MSEKTPVTGPTEGGSAGQGRVIVGEVVHIGPAGLAGRWENRLSAEDSGRGGPAGRAAGATLGLVVSVLLNSPFETHTVEHGPIATNVADCKTPLAMAELPDMTSEVGWLIKGSKGDLVPVLQENRPTRGELPRTGFPRITLEDTTISIVACPAQPGKEPVSFDPVKDTAVLDAGKIKLKPLFGGWADVERLDENRVKKELLPGVSPQDISDYIERANSKEARASLAEKLNARILEGEIFANCAPDLLATVSDGLQERLVDELAAASHAATNSVSIEGDLLSGLEGMKKVYRGSIDVKPPANSARLGEVSVIPGGEACRVTK